MKNPKIKVFGFVPYDRSGKVTWALQELGLDYEFEALSYEKNEHRSPAHLARHPMGAIPVLQLDDIVMHESDAILWFLAENFPGLLPEAGTQERATCLQWFHFITGTVGYASSSRWPLKNLPAYPAEEKALDGLNAREFLATTKKDVEESFQGALQVLENLLKNRPYIGEKFSLADLNITYSLGWLDTKGDLVNYPALKEYLARNKARPAAVKAGAFAGK
ncbi:MAG: glutathione S-transferase family protein [Bdellovibrionota bacterium]